MLVSYNVILLCYFVARVAALLLGPFGAFVPFSFSSSAWSPLISLLMLKNCFCIYTKQLTWVLGWIYIKQIKMHSLINLLFLYWCRQCRCSSCCSSCCAFYCVSLVLSLFPALPFPALFRDPPLYCPPPCLPSVSLFWPCPTNLSSFWFEFILNKIIYSIL